MAMVVFSIKISAQFDEQVDNVVPLAADREMQGRQSLFEFRHTALKDLWVFFDQAANQIQVAQRYCRENVVARATVAKECRHIRLVAWRATGWMEECCLSDRIELVHITKTVWVSTRVKQCTHDFDMSVGGRLM